MFCFLDSAFKTTDFSILFILDKIIYGFNYAIYHLWDIKEFIA